MARHVDRDYIVNATMDPDKHEEIKITGKMIEAGMKEFLVFAEYPADNPSLAVTKIFLAMSAASR